MSSNDAASNDAASTDANASDAESIHTISYFEWVRKLPHAITRGEPNDAPLTFTIKVDFDTRHPFYEVARNLPPPIDKRASRGSLGLTAYNDTVFDMPLYYIGRKMIDIDARYWGFIVVKTFGYDEDTKELWEKFWKQWEKMTAKSLRRMGAQGDLRKGLAGRFKWIVLDNPRLEDANICESREVMADLLNYKDFPAGVDNNVCIVMDKILANGFLEKPDQTFACLSDVTGIVDDFDGYRSHVPALANKLLSRVWMLLKEHSVHHLYTGREGEYATILDKRMIYV